MTAIPDPELNTSRMHAVPEGYRQTFELSDQLTELAGAGVPSDEKGRRDLLALLNVMSQLTAGRTRAPDQNLAARITALRTSIIRS